MWILNVTSKYKSIMDANIMQSEVYKEHNALPYSFSVFVSKLYLKTFNIYKIAPYTCWIEANRSFV